MIDVVLSNIMDWSMI